MGTNFSIAGCIIVCQGIDREECGGEQGQAAWAQERYSCRQMAPSIEEVEPMGSGAEDSMSKGTIQKEGVSTKPICRWTKEPCIEGTGTHARNLQSPVR